MSENENISEKFTKLPQYLLLALVLTVVVYVRIRHLTVPLERDEGEFAYMGQLLLKGIPPFTHAYTMKLPGVSAAYALFMFLFGQTPAGIHLGLLIVNLVCIFLVYLLTRRLLDRDAALVSCATFAVLSLSGSVFGLFAHATHFVVLFSLAGFLLLLRSLDSGRMPLLFLSGLCFGLAVTMKQHAALLVIFAILYLVWRVRKTPASDRRASFPGIALFLAGAVVPYALILLWVARAGVFDRFWFWTASYAREYATGPSIRQGIAELVVQLVAMLSAQPLLWLLAAAGGVLLQREREQRTDRVFIFGFLLFSFLATCPGLAFRQHYFVMLLPALSILTGAAATLGENLPTTMKLGRYQRAFPSLLVIIAVALGFYLERKHFFTLTSLQVSRATYGTNPFPEAQQIARYLKERTTSADRIAVLGSEPEIYFYADRLSATGYIYMYGLMENQPHAERMQLEMIREIEAARPKYVVVVNVGASWLLTSSSKQTVLDWGESYVKNLYDLVGVIDIIDSRTTRYLWDGNARGYNPASNAFVTVFKRKD